MAIDYSAAPRIGSGFFLNDTIEVAKNVLGKVLVKKSGDVYIAGRVVETEAYCTDDPACHACRGMTKRNARMFGPPGSAYVYFTYGCHHCLNFVTRPEGIAEAVLVRALRPLEGIGTMKTNRRKDREEDLASGPGKLTQAMGIDLEENGADLSGDGLFIVDDGVEYDEIVERPRVGIREATDYLWRFYPACEIKWVSRK